MPSLYETTAVVGDVASSDFTTLYNASGLTVPNAGAGAVSGSLNVGGNLTVQGSSQLIGPVTLGSTLCLPDYCFPSGDGTSNQVIATDGSGNLYWADVASLTITYDISATTATGGANLTLTGSDSSTDSVKFAGGANVTVTRTDANTITISSTADDIPDGTAAGQVLTWNGSAWTADNVVTATSTGILTAEFQNNTTTTASSFAVRRNTGSSAYTTGTDSLALFQFDSNSQAVASVGAVGFAYSATDPVFGIATSTNNFSTSTFISKIDSTDIQFNGTNLVLNFNHTGTPTQNASITVERGSSTDATLTWDETQDRWEFNTALYAQDVISTDADSIYINADNTSANSFLYMKGSSQYLKWNNSSSRFEFSSALYATGAISTDADSISINADDTAADSYLYMKGTSEYLKWNNTNTRFEFNDDLYVAGTIAATGTISTDADSISINADSTAADSYLYMQGTSKSLKYDNANTRFEFNDDLNVTGQVDATAIVIDSQAALDTNTGTVTSTSTITVTQTTRNVMKVVVYIVDNVTSDVHTVEALLLRNGATALLTTYGEMYSTAALATFSADISGGALRLRATPASSNSTTFSSVRTSLT